MSDQPFWRTHSLDDLSDEQWESLCDGCGKCCLNKLQDEDTGEVYYTRVACKLLDHETGCCNDYPNRLQQVPDCLDLRHADASVYTWLPATCAYRLLATGADLPEWHHLRTGDRESMHRAICTTRQRVLSETDVDPESLEDHIIAWADR